MMQWGSLLQSTRTRYYSCSKCIVNSRSLVFSQHEVEPRQLLQERGGTRTHHIYVILVRISYRQYTDCCCGSTASTLHHGQECELHH